MEVRVRNEGDRGKAMRCGENWDENRWILFCFEIIGSSSENFYCAFGRAYYYARRPVSLRSSQTDIQEQKPPVKTDPEKRKRWRPSVRPSLHPHSLRQLLLSLFVCVFLCVCLCGSGLAGAARETQFHSHSPSLSHPQPHPKEASDEIYCRTHQTWRNNTDPAEETRIDAAADRPPYQTRHSKKSPNRAYLRDVTLHHKRQRHTTQFGRHFTAAAPTATITIAPTAPTAPTAIVVTAVRETPTTTTTAATRRLALHHVKKKQKVDQCFPP